MEKESILFTPGKIGPLTLRNRTIRAAAFESMCPGNAPSDMLYDYHKSVASGGIGMTTLAYAAVTQSGLSFERQLWMRPDIIPGLKHITDAIHKEGAAASVQLGHCGNMSHKNICGCRPISASSGFNIYSPTLVRGMKPSEITAMAKAFGQAVHLAREAGMDAVEIHAGHGYLISQFLSPYTNHRKDEYGGSLQNRMRFMKMCMDEVMKAAGQDMAVLVKMNMRDGFKGGMEIDESIQVAKRLLELGAHGLVLSGGFVSKAPMYVMRGAMPIRSMSYYMNCWWLKYGVRMFGKWMIPSVPFKEAYFDIMYGEGISKWGEMVDLAVQLELINKSGSWFSIGDERIGQGRDSAKQYLIDHPDVADRIEQEIRDNMWKLQGKNAKPPASAAAKPVSVSADDFNDD